MASVDAVAMPSRWEAYGLVALEARAARSAAAGFDGGRVEGPCRGRRDRRGNHGVAGWTTALDRLASGVDAARVQAARDDAAEATRNFADAWAALVNDQLHKEGEAVAA